MMPAAYVPYAANNMREALAFSSHIPLIFLCPRQPRPTTSATTQRRQGVAFRDLWRKAAAMPSKDKKKASSSKTKSSSSSSSKKDSSKDKKKKSSSSKRGSKSKSPSRRRKSSVTEDEEQPGPTAVGAMTAPSAVMPSSSADQQDPKASSDFEAGLLFQR